MKPTLLFATLSMVFASPTLSAKSELETLRARCAEQERQIQQLEQENAKLRSVSPTHQPGSQNESAAAKASKPAAEIAKTSETPQPSTSGTYVVKKGDSIEKIARKTGTSPITLGKLNGLKSNSVIHPGQTLKLPGGAAIASVKTVEPAPAKPQAEVAVAASGRTYTIKDNDTFSSISRKEGIPVSKLIAANPKVKPTTLRTGQVINLGAPKSKPTAAPATAVAKTPATPTPKPSEPVKAPAPQPATPILAEKSHTPAPAPVAQAPATPPPAETTPAPTTPAVAKSDPAPAPAPAAAPETTSPTPEKKIRPITIDGEMTYGEFAAKHGTNPERLNALNGLDLNNTTVLAKGSELYVPAQP